MKPRPIDYILNGANEDSSPGRYGKDLAAALAVSRAVGFLLRLRLADLDRSNPRPLLQPGRQSLARG